MNQELNPRRLLTPEDAAACLGVTKKTLENWRATGNGPGYAKLSGKCVRYQPADLDAYIERCRRTNTAQG